MANHVKIEPKNRSAKMDAIDIFKMLKRIPNTGDKEAQLAADVLIPPDNIATKSDIERLEAATKSDIEKLETATKTDIAKLEAATKLNLEKLKIELIRWNMGVALFVTVVLGFLIKF